VSLLGTAALLAFAPPAAAQEEPVEAVDSTALRLRQRLRLLGLPPGDSSQATPPDSVAPAPPVRLLPDSSAMEERPSDLLSALRALPGYAAAEYRGSSAEYRAGEGVLFLYGDSLVPAQLEREGDRLRADSLIRYHEESGDVEARGSPVFAPADGDEVQSRALTWNLEREQGAALTARTQMTQNAMQGQWIVTGDLPLIRSELAYGHKTHFTTCELDEPHYHFETEELKIVRGRILVARPVKLYFGDVPVAWLPFMATSLERGRSSGLLRPTFSVNDIVRASSGYRRRVSNLGFYWAMSDYTDALLALDWFDDNYLALTGSMQYRWLRQFLDGSLTMRQYWRAEGGTEFTLGTHHSWQMSERTSFRMSGAFASSSRFVARNTFNPRELTQSINSQGGLDRRFDWGTLALSANRQHFLSDDQVDMTLPDLSLSLKTITLFQAPANRAGWFNNLTMSGGGNLRRQTRTFAEDSAGYDTGTLNGSMRGSLNVGDLRLSGSVTYRESSTLGFPRDSLRFFGDPPPLGSVAALQAIEGRLAAQEAATGERVDVSDERLDWNASISYQQTLIGSTSITPNVTFSRTAMRNDSSEFAREFVSAPLRMSVGASLNTDLYGFYPGVGPFERIRHKFSPGVSFDYSPAVVPTELQSEVFGTRAALPNRVLTISLGNTFEAKRRLPDDTAAAPPPVPDSAELADSLALAADSAALAGLAPGLPQAGGLPDDGLRRRETGEVVTLLGLSTNALVYDFVADSSGNWLDGFQTLEISTTITSHYLRGLQINMSHDLWNDPLVDDGGLQVRRRSFDLRLNRLNLGFSLTNQSAIFRWLGLGGSEEAQRAPPSSDEELAGEPELPGAGVTDETSIIPGERPSPRTRRSRTAEVGQWNASIRYSLLRPRFGSTNTQAIQANLQLQPTEKWEMTWQTGYDLEENEFLDHVVRLSRDLHRWQAHFDFRQTSTGNWTFRFEVSLIDNQELKFDYEQRNLDTRGREFF
jgi:hypothetical protein